jgi:hypothetical protein
VRGVYDGGGGETREALAAVVRGGRCWEAREKGSTAYAAASQLEIAKQERRGEVKKGRSRISGSLARSTGTENARRGRLSLGKSERDSVGRNRALVCADYRGRRRFVSCHIERASYRK